MAITLSALLATPALRLQRVGTSPVTDVPVQWVAVTELEDPKPFLSGGEVVLTTGLRQKSATSQRNFVRHVHASGALAVGFAIGLSHETVPAAFLDQADELGLPVFRVPYETPFIAIGKIVADSLSAEHYARLENLLKGHQVLASALLGGGGLPQLLRELAGMLRTEVALSQYGSPIFATGTGGEDSPDRSWHRLPVATGLKDRCTLAIAEPYERDAIVDYAQSLISVELSNQARRRASDRAVVGQLLQDVVRGTLSGNDAAARLGSAGIDTARRLCIVLVDVATGQRRALRTLPVPSRQHDAVTAVLDDRLVLAVPESDGESVSRELSEYLHGAGFTAKVGFGGGYAQPSGLRWSYFEARESLNRGLPVNRPDRLSLTSLLMASEDVPLADLAAEALDPVAAFDARHGAELMLTLEKYLALNGSVAAVADALELHRNTVRYRLQQIVELTGYDPTTTADRVHLYLALNVRNLR
ncbi:PucR family transcriptional regulator [Arthrobacter sp. JZ12]|uniref:PucR family transcriptional regulator n=1 Tax=Arthrobacter sp. JZ12 TaxID=2654190 RepID=UPI002B473EC6|nr:PucR family transcriptional regulator ligand-binding domain-containing protein [Arthrobacter sp. JZ12]WRH25683.1 PucR family transcriptional regulator [Arthrobacter sp. JZ12]